MSAGGGRQQALAAFAAIVRLGWAGVNGRADSKAALPGRAHHQEGATSLPAAAIVHLGGAGVNGG